MCDWILNVFKQEQIQKLGKHKYLWSQKEQKFSFNNTVGEEKVLLYSSGYFHLV